MASSWVLINKILLILISTSGIFLAFWVLFANKKAKVNQSFFLFTIFILLWITFLYLLNSPSQIRYAALWIKLASIAVFLFFISMYFFVTFFPSEKQRYLLLDGIVLSFIIASSLISIFTNLLIKSVEFREGTAFLILGRLWFPIYAGVFLLTILILGILFKKYFKLSREERLRTQYFLVGISVFALMNIIFNVILVPKRGMVPYTYFGNYSAIFLLGFTAYAIVKKELFGIKVVLTDLLVGVIGIILLVFPFVMPTNILRILAGIIFLLFCIFGYYLIRAVREEEKRRIGAEKLAEQEAKMRESAERFKEVSVKLKEKIIQVLDLEEVIANVIGFFIEIFGVKGVSFALKQAASEFYQFHKTIGFEERDLAIIVRDTGLCSYLREAKRPLLSKELEVIEDRLKESGVALLLPLFQKEYLVGIIFIGEKTNKEPYSKEDIELLEALSYQISISLNNALLYEEIKKDKETLEKFYKVTVGRELKMRELKDKIREMEEKMRGEETKNNNERNL